MRGDTKVRRSTCGSKLHNVGSVGETRSSKDRDPTLAILHSWLLVMHNCALYELSPVVISPGWMLTLYHRSLLPSRMILSTLICDPQTTKWGAGRMRIPAYDTFRDGSEPDVESS